MDWRKPYQGSGRFTNTSGQKGAGVERNSSGRKRRGKTKSRRLLKKTRGRDGSSTRNRGTDTESETSSRRRVADIVLIVDAGRGGGIAGRTCGGGLNPGSEEIGAGSTLIRVCAGEDAPTTAAGAAALLCGVTCGVALRRCGARSVYNLLFRQPAAFSLLRTHFARFLRRSTTDSHVRDVARGRRRKKGCADGMGQPAARPREPHLY